MGKNQETADAEMNALLSIIVPVYNTAPWLPRCLESLIEQTYRNLEIICVDDGSTDGSAAILDEYAARDARIKVLHQENAGVSAARNAGLDAATGEYVTFVDADDWVESDTYGRTIHSMADEVDLVCFGMSIDGDIPAEQRRGKEDYYQIRYSGVKDCGSAEILSTDASSSNKIYRKSLLDLHRLRYVEGRAYGEDAAFYVCYAAIARETCYLPEKLYHYVQRDTSAMAVSARKNARCIDHLLILRDVIPFFQKNQLSVHRAELLSRVFSCFYGFAAYHTPPEMRDEVDELAYEIGREYGVCWDRHSAVVRALLSKKASPWCKLFHWFTGNRECFGICGRALYSITYEEQHDVHRLIGRCIKKVKVEETA